MKKPTEVRVLEHHYTHRNREYYQEPTSIRAHKDSKELREFLRIIEDDCMVNPSPSRQKHICLTCWQFVVSFYTSKHTALGH